MATNRNSRTVSARETMEVLLETSNLLNTGLDAETLAVCVRLCEKGVNPEALAMVIQELRRGTSELNASQENESECTT